MKLETCDDNAQNRKSSFQYLRKMEVKQQSLLLVKSASALHSVVILAVLFLVLYDNRRITKLEQSVKICQDKTGFEKRDSKLMSSSIYPAENHEQQQPQKSAKEALKQLKVNCFKVFGNAPVNKEEDERLWRSVRSADGNQRLPSKPKIQRQNVSKHITTHEKYIIIQGERGPPGKPGVPGPQGPPGPRGKRGRRGNRGRKGSAGRTGSPGKQGPKGPAGPDGKVGPPGPIGSPGPVGSKGEKGDTNVVGIKGDKGDTGAQGPPGVQGIKGDKGVQGDKGESGGQKGDTGATGKQGPKGDVGPSCSGTLLKQPSFKTYINTMTVSEDETAYLYCNASANPVSQITWVKDNKTLIGRRFITSQSIIERQGSEKDLTCPNKVPHPITQSILAIKTLQGSDSGTYTCRAANLMGLAEYAINVTVQLKVRLIITPSGKTVVEGKDVDMRCRATGIPPPMITWQREDGKQLPHKRYQFNGNLRIINISKGDEGVYVCVASNVLGFRQAKALLTVNVPPSLTRTSRKSIKILEGRQLTLPCSASGTPVPKITWSRLNGSLPSIRSTHNNKQLTIGRVVFDDRGVYVCQAVNSVGSIKTQTNVTVLVPPRIISRPKPIEIGYRGRNKTLVCKVFGFPPPSITWSGPPTLKKRTKQTKMGLVLTKVKLDDVGRYTCTARNSLGLVEARTILAAQEVVPPAFTSKPKELAEYRENQSVLISCEATGNPKPNVKWIRRLNHRVSPVVEGPGKSYLRILSLKAHDQGNYTCNAINEFGDSVSGNLFLDINECLSATACDSNADCSNNRGSYNCTCKATYSGDGHRCYLKRYFDSTGRAGRVGPIQQYTIPRTGVYLIQAGGARGGTHSYNYGYKPGTYYGGKGATTEGKFRLAAGTTLKIVVGQRGGNSVEVKGGPSTTSTAAQLGTSVEDNAGTGGGGGTFVYKTDNTLLIAAGGGGGASGGYNGVDGQSGTGGASSEGKDSSYSRTGGSGGQPGQCNSAGASYHGGVGAGWFGQGCSRAGSEHGERGGSRAQGWVGGRAGGMNSGHNGGPTPGAVGGFGGGGGGSEDNGASGGGGGYSGGGSGTHNKQAGGGGGSYCSGSGCSGVTGGNSNDHGFVSIGLHSL